MHKTLITTIKLVCMHVEVTLRERELVRGHSKTKKNIQGKTIDKSTKET